jgi:hypothetical protein
MRKKIKGVLTIMMSIITIMGLVTFNQFILEEGFQTIMFGTWPAADANRWDVVAKGTVMMERINKTSKFINKYFGWINPLAYVSYGSYCQSADFYIEALRAKVLANAPEELIGHRVNLKFRPSQTMATESGILAVNGRFGLLLPHGSDPRDFIGQSVSLTGELVKRTIGNRSFVTIDTSHIN